MYVLRRDANSPTAAVELWFRAPGAGYDSQTPGISRLAIASVAASKPAGGSSLAQLVTEDGGTLEINVYPDIAMIGAGVPSWDLPKVLRAMTAAYFSASINDDGYRTALRDCAIAGAELQFDPDRTLQDVLFSHLFSSGPAHYPPVPQTAQDFSKIPIETVRTFAARAFREPNAVLTLTGSFEDNWLPSVHRAAIASTPASGGMDRPFDSPASSRATDISQPSAVSGLGFAWTGPPITDARAATAMDFIADYLFDGDHGTVAREVHKASNDAFLNGQFITLHDPGVLLVTVSGSNAQTMRSKIAAAVEALQTPMDRKTFDAAKNAFLYHIISQVQTPESRADNFGWYAAEGNLQYAPGDVSGEYVQNAQSLDPGYVAQVVRQYLQHPAVVQLTPAHSEGTAS